MSDLKKIFIPLFLFLNFNLAYSMTKIEVEKKLNEHFGDSVNSIVVESWIDSYKVDIRIKDDLSIEKLINYLTQEESYLFSYLKIKGKIGNEGAQSLSEALAQYKGLKFLDLSSCEIGDQGAKALAQMVLKQIEEDEKKFSKLLESSKLLKLMNLNMNGFSKISNQTLKENSNLVATVYKTYILKFLQECLIEKNDNQRLKSLRKEFEGEFENDFLGRLKSEIEPVGNYLWNLCLAENQIKDEGLLEFFEIFRRNLFFKLDLRKNNISLEGFSSLLKEIFTDLWLSDKSLDFKKNSNLVTDFFVLTYPNRLINLDLRNNGDCNILLPLGDIFE